MVLSGIALNTERGCQGVIPMRQRVKDRIEKKRMGKAAKERQSRQAIGCQVKEKQSTERKERKARVGKKTLAVGWERRETGACRSGVGRGNQEGGGGPVVQLTKMYTQPVLPFGSLFSAPFSWSLQKVPAV